MESKMSRRPEFKVQAPRRKPALITRVRRKAPPPITITHATLGQCKLVGLHLSDSGIWLADCRFPGGQRRMLQLTDKFFVEPIASIVEAAKDFPQEKTKAEPVEREPKAESADESEEETAELDAGRAFLGDRDDGVETDADEENGDGAELEEIA
jgi:hypothetical protein